MKNTLAQDSKTGRDAAGHFKKGTTGNPRGRPKRKSLTAHLEEALTDDARKKICRKLVSMAKDGDLKAAELIFERIDGKVPQKVDITSRVRDLAQTLGLDPDEAVREAMIIVGDHA